MVCTGSWQGIEKIPVLPYSGAFVAGAQYVEVISAKRGLIK